MISGKLLINKSNNTLYVGDYVMPAKSSLKLSISDFYKLENTSNLASYIKSKVIGCYNTQISNLVTEDNKLTIEQDNTIMKEPITTNNVELKVEDSVKEETNSTSKLITDEPTKTTITSRTNRRGRRKKNNK